MLKDMEFPEKVEPCSKGHDECTQYRQEQYDWTKTIMDDTVGPFSWLLREFEMTAEAFECELRNMAREMGGNPKLILSCAILSGVFLERRQQKRREVAAAESDALQQMLGMAAGAETKRLTALVPQPRSHE